MNNETRRDEFFEEHGANIRTPDGHFTIFVDGAEAENSMTGWGRLSPPPEDDWQRSKNIAKYWECVAKKDEEAFRDCKMYLSGTGFQPVALRTCYTDEERLEVLRDLQNTAKKSRAKFLAAKRKVKRETPFWVEQRQQQEVEEQARKQNFRNAVDQFNL